MPLSQIVVGAGKGALSSAHAPRCEVGPAAIESLPHLAAKVQTMWATRDLDTFIHQVLIDSRDGQRQGLPVAVAAELLFVAKINQTVRTMETASRLQLSLAEAGAIIEAGDRAALGFAGSKDDPWSEHAVLHDKNRGAGAGAGPQRERPATPVRSVSAAASGSIPVVVVPAAAKSAPVNSTQSWLSIFLNETPPLPSTVRLDLTAPETGHDSGHDGAEMCWDLFRCLAREIRGLGGEELALSHLGSAGKCLWLPDAIHFAKHKCHFPQVVLRTDLLAATEQQLDAAIAAGLSSLVINFNLASAKWRAWAEEMLALNPDYFVARIQRIVQKRDEHYSRSRHRCVLSVCQIGDAQSSEPLTATALRLAEMAELESFEWCVEAPGAGGGAMQHHPTGAGDCLCWVPFTEANVRANGHLVVCAHDHSGASVVADLKGTEFEHAWHSAAFRKTRQGVLKGELKGTLCAHCAIAAPRKPQRSAQAAP